MVIDDVGGASVNLIVAFIETFCPCKYIYIQHEEHLILSWIVTQHSLHPNIKVKFESFLGKKVWNPITDYVRSNAPNSPTRTQTRPNLSFTSKPGIWYGGGQIFSCLCNNINSGTMHSGSLWYFSFSSVVTFIVRTRELDDKRSVGGITKQGREGEEDRGGQRRGRGDGEERGVQRRGGIFVWLWEMTFRRMKISAANMERV